MGDRILTTSRIQMHRERRQYQMHRDRRQYQMLHSEIVAGVDGKVVEIDSVCTGARPS